MISELEEKDGIEQNEDEEISDYKGDKDKNKENVEGLEKKR